MQTLCFYPADVAKKTHLLLNPIPALLIVDAAFSVDAYNGFMPRLSQLQQLPDLFADLEGMDGVSFRSVIIISYLFYYSGFRTGRHNETDASVPQ